MEVTVNIEKCDQCRHVGHSGAFTIRGARKICSHPNASSKRKTLEEFLNEYPEYKGKYKDYNKNHWKYHWFNRTIDRDDIPDWCPLKYGARY